MTKVCCVCQRVLDGDRWFAYALPADERVTHGYCPDCFSEAMAALDEFTRRQRLVQAAGAGRSCPLPVGGACV